MNRVTLSKDEGQWFSRNVIKTHHILKTAAQKDPKVLERKTYKTLDSILPQATEMAGTLEQLPDEPLEFDISLSRKQKLIIYQMIQDTIKTLEGFIIPKYKERELKEYEESAKSKTMLLKKMARKFR